MFWEFGLPRFAAILHSAVSVDESSDELLMRPLPPFVCNTTPGDTDVLALLVLPMPITYHLLPESYKAFENFLSFYTICNYSENR